MASIWEAWWQLFFNVLVAINSVVHIPGVAIIIFTLLIKVLTVPLTMKALRSTRNMQQIQPLIKEIQKKYGKDRAKQQEETMKIYQQYGVNPAAGCFPILVQLPVFFALFSALDFTIKHGADATMMAKVLWNDAWVPWANFNGPFLWSSSLAKPDDLIMLGGFTIGLWPFISGAFQFLQSRMSIPVRDPNQPLDSQTKMMQTMMQYMPIYIILISFGFPAGTVIYWAVSNIFSAVQQYFITGFGTLPAVPGFKWLPTKAPVVIVTPPPPPSAGTAKKGLMMRMMDKAVQAQDAQKAAQASTDTDADDSLQIEPSSGGAKAARNGGAGNGKNAPTSKAQSKQLTNGKASESETVAPTITAKYASDLRYKKPASGNGANGAHHEELNATIPTVLPKKKRGKR